MRCLSFSWSVLVVLLVVPEPVPAWKGDIVKAWARTLGDEVWRLSEALTKSDQIRIKYKQMNASVKKKDGIKILESSLRSVSTMLQQKIKAVKCIHATAQKLAQEFNDSMTEDPNFDFKYCSSKYSNFEYEDEKAAEAANKYEITIPRFAKDNPNYLNISLEKDSHFYDISVNTNISCVHVPTNIYYKEKDALNAILWSKGLNEMFTKNYQSDPSLSWQYFGSSHGILRFYPGMPWNRKEVDTYDCRVKSWYIEAATCSKDVIILFDVSGSMTGFKNYVARRTLESLLDTLSNNDYVNVYTVKNETQDAITCFEDLVQATPENLNTIKNILEPTDNGKNHKVPLEGNANLTAAYERAFRQLEEKRNKSHEDCEVSSTQGCNQLVMVITDYVPGNLSEVFEQHNRKVVDGKTYIPVRVFTYLIGKEVTNVPEIRGMACQNRGYFVHIHSVEEVQQQVLKYINVIARPMILEGEDPPPTWTHANIDQTRTSKWGDVSSDVDKPDEDKLVTSVAIPAFDLKYNAEHNDAMLLGVAGTDVPIDSIAKLAQPHQLGVNGYSFIVSNNGYLLLHPLLRTTINGELQANYNSVDFVEVEQVDDGKGPRELGPEIKQLREKLVFGDHGDMPEIRVLFHYDDMRRIFRVSHNYFFNKLEGTPFSMGISLPTQYGDTELMLKDNPLEAKQGKELTGINVTDYFRFSYRVHPDWVYCKYHYLEGHESDNSEEEIWKFLVNLSMNKTDITKKQYSEDITNNEFDVKKHCEKATPLEKDDYYCNEDLVKQVVFDAKLTTPYFKDWDASKEEWDLAEKYNVSVRFIATSSGLTRWHYIFEEDKNEVVDDFGNSHKNFTGKVFGDKYILAIEETWYKAAVLQHMINEESLVIATRLPILDEIIQERPTVQNEDGDITMTASFAIFYKDFESETPASVVGFQFSYWSFQKRFAEITNMTTEPDFTCEGNRYLCYVVDSSGYIVLSKDIEEVGQFFGALNQDTKFVMQSFLEKQVFEHVDVYNYQALCPPEDLKKTTGRAWNMDTPFSIASNFLKWVLVEAILLLSDLSQSWQTLAASIAVNDDYDEVVIGSTEEPATTTQAPVINETIHVKEDEDQKPFSCDHRITLYILNQRFFVEAMGAFPVVSEDRPGECHPRYWASIVSKTNLLLVVVDTKDTDYSANCTKIPPSTKPKVTEESRESGEPCHKLDLGQLKRRRLEGCFTYHEGERNITECGIGSCVRANLTVLFSAILLVAAAWQSS